MFETLIAIGMFMTVIGLMSIGVVFRNKPIKGSCGGLSAIGMESACDFCGKPAEDCPKRKAAAQQAAESDA